MSNDTAILEPGQVEQKSTRLLWLVIGIPTMTVLGCLLTIFLAVSSPDELVSDYSMRTDLHGSE